jgi:hypothetical protein
MNKATPTGSRKNYGASDALACPRCALGRMHVVRRSPDRDNDPAHEVQILRCRACGHEEHRTISKGGDTQN